jgi:hypothetical protein
VVYARHYRIGYLLNKKNYILHVLYDSPKLHNTDLHNLYPSQNIIKVGEDDIDGTCSAYGDEKCLGNFLSENPKRDLFWKHRHRWTLKYVKWIHVAEDKIHTLLRTP